jgi:hypothetical protein
MIVTGQTIQLQINTSPSRASLFPMLSGRHNCINSYNSVQCTALIFHKLRKNKSKEANKLIITMHLLCNAAASLSRHIARSQKFGTRFPTTTSHRAISQKLARHVAFSCSMHKRYTIQKLIFLELSH